MELVLNKELILRIWCEQIRQELMLECALKIRHEQIWWELVLVLEI